MFLDSSVANVSNNKGDVTFLLNQHITIPNEVVGYVSLQELTIPNTNNNVNTTNNVLVLVDDTNNLETFTITPGNYTANSFLTTLNSELANATNNLANTVVSYNDITNKYSIYCPNSASITIDSTSTMNQILGFEEGEIFITGHTLTSTKIIDLSSGNNSFYFTTNLATSNYNFFQSNNGRGCAVLEKIQLTTDSTGIEFFKNINQFKSRFFDKGITNLNIVLYDENGNQWSPSSNWSCVLDFIFYEKYYDTSTEKTINQFAQMYKK
jgi:hypothetical protein